MPAYLIALRREPVRDAEAMAEYQRRTRAISGDFSLVPRVIYGAVEELEGTAPDGVIVIEFPTMEEARAWYHNEDYQAAVPFRQQAADYDLFLVQGIDG